MVNFIFFYRFSVGWLVYCSAVHFNFLWRPEDLQSQTDRQAQNYGQTNWRCTVFRISSEPLVSCFGLFPLRGAGTGFVGVLPRQLIFDPPLYILHFTEKQHKNCFRITGYIPWMPEVSFAVCGFGQVLKSDPREKRVTFWEIVEFQNKT